jgi:hypothetical protein
MGVHAVWVQGDDLLTWEAGTFRSAPHPTGSAQVVTVDDLGAIVEVGVGVSAGQCAVEVRTNDAQVTQAVVPVAGTDKVLCEEIGLSLATPSEIHGDVSGQPGTALVVRRTSAGGWILTARPPDRRTGPGRLLRRLCPRHLEPDRRQRPWGFSSRSDRRTDSMSPPSGTTVSRQTMEQPSRVVHVAGAPTCRRSVGDFRAAAGRHLSTASDV